MGHPHEKIKKYVIIDKRGDNVLIEMGFKISENIAVLALSLAGIVHIFQVSAVSQNADLHYKFNRKFQPAAAESDEE